MPVRRIRSNARILANTGRVALARGPLIYCVEGVDHPGVDLWDLEVPAVAALTARRTPELLGGVTVVEGDAVAREAPADNTPLYSAGDATESAARATRLTAIPYYAWANREAGAMQVWLRERR